MKHKKNINLNKKKLIFLKTFSKHRNKQYLMKIFTAFYLITQ